jgi:hypothetical protein
VNKGQQNRWKCEVLDMILMAFADHPPLHDILIFKGARILNLRLGEESRQSMDIDSNISVGFASAHSEPADQQAYLKKECEAALNPFFQKQDPVRYELRSVRSEMKPTDGKHRFGWTGFVLNVAVHDHRKSSVRGLPVLKIDVAYPEKLGEHAVSELSWQGHSINAYSLARITGEKLRAFLSSLPAYAEKIGRTSYSVRVKDLYDVARIVRENTVRENHFWKVVGDEFLLACKSRYVDCIGLDTFAENSDQTKNLYENDPTLPKDIAFDEAWSSIRQITDLLNDFKITPFERPLPS